MSFDWNQYLVIAEHHRASLSNTVATVPNDEALRRNAISRAYYYAFNKAVQRIEQKDRNARRDGTYRDKDAHGRVANYFEARAGANQTIADNLRVLRKKRNLADYDEDAVITDRDLTEAMRRAKEIVQKLTIV